MKYDKNTKKQSLQDSINHLANVIPNGQLLELLHEAAKIIEGKEKNRVKVRLYKTQMIRLPGQWIDLPLLWGNLGKAQDNVKELKENHPDTQFKIIEIIVIIESEKIVNI